MPLSGPQWTAGPVQVPLPGFGLGLSFPAGPGPPGAVDRSSGCPMEAAQLLGLQPQGLCASAPCPALLPAGTELAGHSREGLGLTSPALGGLCAGVLGISGSH